MNSIIYILNYNSLKYELDRNNLGDYFLDTCKLSNHHFMYFDINKHFEDRDSWINWKNMHHYLVSITKCKYRFK